MLAGTEEPFAIHATASWEALLQSTLAALVFIVVSLTSILLHAPCYCPCLHFEALYVAIESQVWPPFLVTIATLSSYSTHPYIMKIRPYLLNYLSRMHATSTVMSPPNGEYFIVYCFQLCSAPLHCTVDRLLRRAMRDSNYSRASTLRIVYKSTFKLETTLYTGQPAGSQWCPL